MTEGKPTRRSKYDRQERWRKRHPVAASAHKRLRYAVRVGKVERQPCTECGDAKAEAHHPDYTEPLTVEWLCRRHHRERHKSTVTNDEA